MFATTRTASTLLVLRRCAAATRKATFATKTTSSSSNFSKLSPAVQRELLRHVKPKGSGAIVNTKQSAQQAENNSKTYRWLLACVSFVGCTASLPYIATQTIGNLTDRDEKLSPSGVRRGAFANSGSKDAGKDPNWDWQNGKYVHPKGFAEHLEMQSPDQTDFGPDIGPMVAEEKAKNNR